MAFTDAISYLILTAMQTGLRDDLTFEVASTDTIGGIDDDAIIIRKLQPQGSGNRSHMAGYRGEKLPGMIITPGNVTADPHAGTNEQDDYEYRTLIQIVDSDYDKLTNLRTWLRWQEQIAHYFQNQSVIVDNAKGKAYISNATVRNVIDSREWVQHERMVGAVEVRHMSRENRGVT